MRTDTLASALTGLLAMLSLSGCAGRQAVQQSLESATRAEAAARTAEAAATRCEQLAALCPAPLTQTKICGACNSQQYKPCDVPGFPTARCLGGNAGGGYKCRLTCPTGWSFRCAPNAPTPRCRQGGTHCSYCP